MSSIDQQFVEYIVKSLVGNPDAVSIERSIDEKGVLLALSVDPDDLGRVIGKRGATAQSLRTLLRALGTKNDARYNLKIVDNSDPDNRPPRRSDSDEFRPAVTDENTPSETLTKDDKTSTINDDSHDSVVSKTRKELEELDDLDV